MQVYCSKNCISKGFLKVGIKTLVKGWNVGFLSPSFEMMAVWLAVRNSVGWTCYLSTSSGVSLFIYLFSTSTLLFKFTPSCPFGLSFCTMYSDQKACILPQILLQSEIFIKAINSRCQRLQWKISVCVYINFWVKIGLMVVRAFILKASWGWGAGSTWSTSQSSVVKLHIQQQKR